MFKATRKKTNELRQVFILPVVRGHDPHAVDVFRKVGRHAREVLPRDPPPRPQPPAEKLVGKPQHRPEPQQVTIEVHAAQEINQPDRERDELADRLSLDVPRDA